MFGICTQLWRWSPVNPKLLSDRIGHVNEPVTVQIYTHRTTGLDRPIAEQLSRLTDGAVEAAGRAKGISWVGFEGCTTEEPGKRPG
jgi:hypothetical protein